MRASLLRWYGRHRRDLPWRHTDDPYAIWVSEIMCQQTQVATVIPYYRRFLARFPDPGSLARAGEEEVLAAWSGLGYYRRARALHAGAREVLERHGGELPRETPALLALPGIGRYTAGAIASMAFGREEPVLDGNVRRVLSRLHGVDGARLGRAREERRLWELAGELVRGPRPGELNQALMELGALVCKPRNPDCGACPLERDCHARRSLRPESYPVARPRPETRNVRVAVAWIRRGDRVLLERPGPSSPLRGTWDLLALETDPGSDPARVLREGAGTRHGLDLAVGGELARFGHGIMNRRLRVEVLDCRVRRGRASGREDLLWVRPSRLDEVAISGATRKAVRACAVAPVEADLNARD